MREKIKVINEFERRIESDRELERIRQRESMERMAEQCGFEVVGGES